MKTRLIVLLLLLASLCHSSSSTRRSDQRTLVFTVEPPSRVDFYNDTGSVIPCSARGDPHPQVRWEMADGSVADDIPRLRQLRPDGHLIFSPFQAEDYRQDVHATVYRCIAFNSGGAIGSRNVHVKGMVKQPYKIQVFDEYAVRGNTAVLRCSVPSFVKEYISVMSWVRDESITLTSSEDAGGRYSIFPTGELHIRGALLDDSYKTYRCVSRNRISGEMSTSATTGKLLITVPHSSLSPRITHTVPKLESDIGKRIEIPCAAQAYPLPTYTWYRIRDGFPSSLKKLDSLNNFNIKILNSSLLIHETSLQDKGKYVCVVNNSHGQERAETDLLIREKLNVRVLPSSQTVDMGKSAIFTCNVTGHPINGILWRKDMTLLVSTRRIIVTNDEVRIKRVEREDKGLYQCFASNDKDSAQDSAQLILGDVAPVLKFTFEPGVMEPGTSLSLKCIAIGHPLPQVTWTLDDLPIPDHIRFSVGDYVTAKAEVVSFVNISTLRVEDGGVYKCQAANDFGSLSHSAKVHVIGPPFVRMMKDIAAVEGNDLIVRCPVSGYPVEDVYWEKDGRRIPHNHRQRALKNGTLIIKEIERRTDGGAYKCVAKNSQGQRGERQLTIKVLTPPVIEPFLFPDAIEEGSRFKVLCSVNKGDSPITIEWLKDGRQLAFDLDITESTLDEFSKALFFSRIDLKHRGNYTCTASNMAAMDSHTAAMVIHAPPRWTMEPQHMSAVLSTDVALNCVAEGYPKPNIEWKRAEGALASDYQPLSSNAHMYTLLNGSLSIRNVQKTDEGYYMCQAANGIGSGISTVVNLSVRVPARFNEEFTAATVRKGELIKIICPAFGDRPLTINWKKDGQPFDKHSEKQYTIEETLTDEGLKSEVLIQSADRRDSSLFTCVAQNSFGKDEMNIQIIVQERPDKPFKLSTHEITSRSISLSWSPPYSGNSPILLYTIQCKTSSDNWQDGVKETTVSGAESKIVITGLHPAVTYHFRVLAENAFGKSDHSPSITATTDMEVPGGPPLNIVVEALGSHTLKVTWQPPSPNTQNGVLSGYYVGYKLTGSPKPYTYKTLEITGSFRPECLITNLSRLSSYSVIVQAFNRKGAGPPTDEFVVTTIDNDPPSSPILTIISASQFAIKIKWRVPAVESSPLTGFRLNYKRELGGWQELRVPQELRDYSFDNLQCGKKYHFFVTAFNEIGEGLPSDTISGTTLGVAPIAPSSQAFIRLNNTQLSLHLKEWKGGGCPIIFFVIQYRVDSEKDWTLVSDHVLMQTEPFELDNLAQGTFYRLQVLAHNDAGDTQTDYTFNTTITRESNTFAPTLSKNSVPLYSSLAIVAPLIVTISIVSAIITAVCTLSQRRDRDQGACNERENNPKEINMEAVAMSEYEEKQNGSYIQAKDSLYYPSPYATSRVPVFSLEERSSGDSSTEGRSTLRDNERQYDVPFAVKKSGNTKHMKDGKELTQSEVEHLYSFPNRATPIDHSTNISHRKEQNSCGRHWSSEMTEEYEEETQNHNLISATSSGRWQSSSKQGMSRVLIVEPPFIFPDRVS